MKKVRLSEVVSKLEEKGLYKSAENVRKVATSARINPGTRKTIRILRKHFMSLEDSLSRGITANEAEMIQTDVVITEFVDRIVGLCGDTAGFEEILPYDLAKKLERR